jgi:hypothetical protein
VPRFHFHIQDGRSLPDQDGTVLDGLQAARLEAIRTAGRLLEDDPGDIWDSGAWKMVVTDAQGAPLFTLAFYAQTSGAGDGRQPLPAND